MARTLDDFIAELPPEEQVAIEQASQVDIAFAHLNLSLSGLAQAPSLRAKLDSEQRRILRYLCEELVKALKEDGDE